MRKKPYFPLYLLVLLVILSYSVIFAPIESFGKAPDKSAINTGKTINIALVVPEGGVYSFFSKQFMNGLFLSASSSGGSKIRYVIISLPYNAGAARVGYIFSYLAKRKISAVVGPMFANQLKYFATDSVKYKIPVITPSSLVPKKFMSPFLFSYGMTLKQEIKTDLKYAAYANIRSVSVIYPDYGYGSKLLRYIRRFSKQYGVKVLNTTAYGDKTVDFFYNFNSIVRFTRGETGHMTKAEEEQLGVTPYDLMNGITKATPYIPFKGLFVLGSLSKLELILTQLMYYNMKGFAIFGLSSLDSAAFMAKYGFYMQDAIFPDGFFKHDDNKIVKKFDLEYKKNYDEMPNILNAEGYDIGRIIIRAVHALRYSNRNGQAQSAINLKYKDNNAYRFYKALLAVKSFKGVCGISKLKNGRFKKPLYLFKYKNDKVYILESPF